MTAQVRENEVFGALDQRLLILENNKWEKWFGKHPGIVLGTVVVTLCSAFWVYHTWQVERIDKKHTEQIASLQKLNKDRLEWLKEQQKQRSLSYSEKCSLEKDRLTNKLSQCIVNEKKNITSNSTGLKTAG